VLEMSDSGQVVAVGAPALGIAFEGL